MARRPGAGALGPGGIFPVCGWAIHGGKSPSDAPAGGSHLVAQNW